jgi:hypothetical protein
MRSNQWMVPFRHAREQLEPMFHRHPRHSHRGGIIGLIFLGLLVGLGIYIWPELQRTVRMHRM